MTDKKRIKSYPSATMGVIIGAIIGTILFLLVSCQPNEPLKGLNCPCKVITAEITPRGHKVTYIDKDGELSKPVISKALYDQYHKKKPINK